MICLLLAILFLFTGHFFLGFVFALICLCGGIKVTTTDGRRYRL